VLNSGFENWGKENLPFQIPDVTPTVGFQSSNHERVDYGVVNMTKISRGVGYAMRLETVTFTRASSLDTSVAYALWGVGGDGGSFSGGFPFSDQNITSLKVDMRYNINPLSPRLVLIQFKKNVVTIGGGNPPMNAPGIYAFLISGSQSTFAQMTFNISPALPMAPDTCIIGFASNNPFGNGTPAYPGDYMEIDNLIFETSAQAIPGGNLDNWVTAQTPEKPQYWNLSDGEENYAGYKTTDSYAGSLAIQFKVIDRGNGNMQLQRTVCRQTKVDKSSFQLR
jgi:hypothetical protein